MKLVSRAALLLLLLLTGPALLAAQEPPLLAGEGGVPVPKKTKHVQPVYPPEAQAQGLRGIVILDLVIGPNGHVTSATVVRTVPGLDEAAIAAARQWEYEPVKVNGKPVSVRLTQAITFSLALPKLAREPGIPELRQGVAPALPKDAGRGTAAAEVSLEADGRIAAARIVEGGEPWAGALLHALQTWRFTPPPEDASLSFRVQADFDPGRAADSRILLKASGVQRGDLLAEAAPGQQGPPPAAPPAGTATPPSAPAPPATAPATPPADQPGSTQAEKSSPGERPAAPPPGAPAQPGSGPDAGPPRTPAAPAPGAPGPGPTNPAGPNTAVPPPTAAPPPATPASPVSGAPGAASAPGPGRGTAPGNPAPADRTAPPPVEVITAPPPQQPPENGISAIRDVSLEPGVPDLTRGRRPVPPPLARIAGAEGTVEVAFSVSAAGTTLVQSVAGPDLLKKAAEQAVASWVFRRTRTDRAYLTAVFNYGGDKATAVVRPQPAPSAAAQAGSLPTPQAPARPAPAAGSTASPAPAPATLTAPPPTANPPAGTPPAPPAPGPGTPGSPPAPRRPSNPASPPPQS